MLTKFEGLNDLFIDLRPFDALTCQNAANTTTTLALHNDECVETHQLRIKGGKLVNTTWESRRRAFCGNWVKIKINDTHSKNVAIASATPSPSRPTSVDQNWNETMDTR